jgi:hypothetical protein
MYDGALSGQVVRQNATYVSRPAILICERRKIHRELLWSCGCVQHQGRSNLDVVPSSPDDAMTISRRLFAGAAAAAGMVLATLGTSARALAGSGENAAINGDKKMPDEIVKAKIRRALLSGPEIITREATVAWMLDALAGKPKPSNTTPGLIYMLNGALQRSYTDPFDRTSPAIPIGPHWMILWPFDAALAGLPTVMRAAGSLVMFAGTPYAHLHICGSPWDGNEYHPGDRGIWTMRYARP